MLFVYSAQVFNGNFTPQVSSNFIKIPSGEATRDFNVDGHWRTERLQTIHATSIDPKM